MAKRKRTNNDLQNTCSIIQHYVNELQFQKYFIDYKDTATLSDDKFVNK